MKSFLKRTFLIAFLLLCAFLQQANALDISPAEVALGDIISAPDIFEKKIKIKNDGRQPVFLVKVRTSCSCIVLENNEKKEIKPGETYVIRLRVMLKEFGKGKFRKYLFLHFENTEKPRYVVHIYGNKL
jgi:hypothetical protein